MDQKSKSGISRCAKKWRKKLTFDQREESEEEEESMREKERGGREWRRK